MAPNQSYPVMSQPLSKSKINTTCPGSEDKAESNHCTSAIIKGEIIRKPRYPWKPIAVKSGFMSL